MERIPEPELMEGESQARAYSEADFEGPHDAFVDLAARAFPRGAQGRILDLGCGPADITVRFARRHPGAQMVGVDGSKAMLDFGVQRVAALGMGDRISLQHLMLPAPDLLGQFDGAISNSLLHHLHDPQVLWESLTAHMRPGSPVFIMDLMRPESVEAVEHMVEEYAAGEPDVLRRDFFLSLRAAFRIEEVQIQLEEAGLSHLQVEAVSDRHLVVYGLL
jgi:SAM-dependent methyltransferase